MTSTIKGHIFTKSRGATLAAALLLTSVSASTAKAATVTLSSRCTFAKAVASINAQKDATPCTHTGSYGTNDTVVVPKGTFNIQGRGVDITRSMTIHGGGKYDAYLQAISGISDLTGYAIQVADPNIVVKIDNLTLAGEDVVTGILVNGENDKNLNDNNLELNLVVITSCGDSGIRNEGGRVLVRNSLIYLNHGIYGGGVANVNTANDDATLMVGTFVSKFSSISINSATVTGGGIYSTGKLDVRSSNLQQNSAQQDGGAIFVAAAATYGYCNVSRDTPTAVQSDIDSSSSPGYSIISTTIPCDLHTTIGGGNTSPYCSNNATNCPNQ